MYKTSLADPLVATGGVALFVEMLIFSWTLLDVVRKSPKKTGPAEIWILSGILWAVVSGTLHLAITLRHGNRQCTAGKRPLE
jgi:hypothetical protein